MSRWKHRLTPKKCFSTNIIHYSINSFNKVIAHWGIHFDIRRKLDMSLNEATVLNNWMKMTVSPRPSATAHCSGCWQSFIVK